ncbi:DUF868 domain-containing protein [Senna tora]|uniref:DUF868 domain-containing protein n=1 Tax=Senna tora TaxID=362788 RepID=A0A834WVC0_9FABA|nr:DUF868 domain-containing protein [Senna tora]
MQDSIGIPACFSSAEKLIDDPKAVTRSAQDMNLWKILNRVEQEISLTYIQTKHFLFRGGGGFFSFTLPKHFCVFFGKICCNETTVPRDLFGGHGSSFDGESFCCR